MNAVAKCALVCVKPELAAEVWPLVAQMINSVFLIGIGDDTIDDLYKDVLSGDALLWIAWDEKQERILSCCTTKLVILRHQTCCYVTACAGRELKQWLDLLAGIEQYARNEGCDIFRIRGRHGWKRLLASHGYTEPWVTLEKGLRG